LGRGRDEAALHGAKCSWVTVGKTYDVGQQCKRQQTETMCAGVRAGVPPVAGLRGGCAGAGVQGDAIVDGKGGIGFGVLGAVLTVSKTCK